MTLDTIKCDKFHQKFVLLTNFEATPESQLQLAVLGMNSLIMRLDANATDTAATDIYGGGKKNADWARRMELFLGMIKGKKISKSEYFSSHNKSKM